ncbi:MAG: hypothetical protein M1830_010134, partial [Pleopsidium flavum]
MDTDRPVAAEDLLELVRQAHGFVPQYLGGQHKATGKGKAISKQRLKNFVHLEPVEDSLFDNHRIEELD